MNGNQIQIYKIQIQLSVMPPFKIQKQKHLLSVQAVLVTTLPHDATGHFLTESSVVLKSHL